MCTTVIVGRLASTTGRVILGHNEDSGGRCMHQQFWVPGGSHSAGEFVEGEPGRARVPQAPVTLGTYWSNMLAPAPGSSFDQGMANDACAQTRAATLMTVTSRTKKSVCSKAASGFSFAAV